MTFNEDQPPEWITQAKARGLGNVLGLALDVLEPLGPLGAQVVWLTQPVLGLWIPRATLGELAEALDAPGGVERLRHMLESHE
ncbi:MAG: hypothetical protein K8L97_13440 [Anaerolineae bacterium]|nr:hypothetical protein [Anaerolineae bacterium]